MLHFDIISLNVNRLLNLILVELISIKLCISIMLYIYYMINIEVWEWWENLLNIMYIGAKYEFMRQLILYSTCKQICICATYILVQNIFLFQKSNARPHRLESIGHLLLFDLLKMAPQVRLDFGGRTPSWPQAKRFPDQEVSKPHRRWSVSGVEKSAFSSPESKPVVAGQSVRDQLRQVAFHETTILKPLEIS